MQTVTFYCPHCNNLMAAGLELLGQQVQCPTCHRVVIAPNAPPPEDHVEPQVSFDEPDRPVEEHESIFNEEHDEDLFGSRRPKIEVPGGSAMVMSPSPMPGPATNFAVYPPDVPPPDAGARFESPPSSYEPEPTLAPADWPTAPEPEPGWSPEADDTLGAPIEIAPRPVVIEARKGTNLLLTILGPYAVLMTLLAGYFLYKWRTDGGNDHPLANIPDASALFDAPTRRDITKRVEHMPPVDAPLPDSLKVKLGGTLAIGDLEVTPERIERGPVTVHTIAQNNQKSVTQLPGEALLLHLRVKNRSGDVSFCPTDPVFDRYHDKRRGSRPYNQVVVGSERYYGGAIDVLAINRNVVKRKFVGGQENDDRPLPPGEARQTVVCTDPQDVVADAVAKHQGDEPIIWRVQLRRGLQQFRGKEYPVCAVVGVQFSPSDVKVKN